MATKDIRTRQEAVVCAVCGRTLLRGERWETYVAGGTRRDVCELCAPRAQHEGWVREDGRLDATPVTLSERRRSLLGRLRGALERPDRLDEPPTGEPAPRRAPAPARPVREPRHVRAVPTSTEQRTLVAMELFNASEHTRTVAGVARSLGAPQVCARPSARSTGLVTITVGWELCWYRYEVDLSSDGEPVRQVGKGHELAELEPDELAVNAVADEYGTLAPA